MMMRPIFCLVLILVMHNGFAQQSNDSTFTRITDAVSKYKIDTTTPPPDKNTRLIIQLRELKGGFNINEAIRFKMQEDLQKKELTQQQYDQLHTYFSSGTGKRLLDNAVIWIYRQQFSTKELKQLVKFYKTVAGQKLSANFPVIMLQTLAAAQVIKDQLKMPKE